MVILEDKEKNKTYAVYIHKFPNEKVYIGATRQKPIHRRWRSGQGYKNQKNLFNAITEFGWDNIEHIIVKDGLAEEDAQELEKALIVKYDAQNPEKGYNTKNGGQVFGEHSDEFLDDLNKRMVGNTYCVGRKLSQKHIDALRKSHKNSSYVRPKGVYKLSDDSKKKISEKAKERWSDPVLKEQYLKSKPDMTGVNNPMYGKTQSKETREKIRQKATGRKLNEITREKYKQNSSKGVVQYDLQMHYVAEFSSCKEAGLSLGGNGVNVGFCCRNPHRTYKGFYWRFSGKDGNHFQKKEGVSQ